MKEQHKNVSEKWFRNKLINLQEFDRYPSVVVIARSKRMAEDFTVFLGQYSIKSHYLHGEIDANERKVILDDFLAGEFQVLVTIPKYVPQNPYGLFTVVRLRIPHSK